MRQTLVGGQVDASTRDRSSRITSMINKNRNRYSAATTIPRPRLSGALLITSRVASAAPFFVCALEDLLSPRRSAKHGTDEDEVHFVALPPCPATVDAKPAKAFTWRRSRNDPVCHRRPSARIRTADSPASAAMFHGTGAHAPDEDEAAYRSRSQCDPTA